MPKLSDIDQISDLKETLVAYTKQETLEPVKSLGRYLGFGIAGALLLFLGTMFASLGTLRWLQTLEQFSGESWMSTIPYLASLGVLLFFILVLLASLFRAKRKVA